MSNSRAFNYTLSIRTTIHNFQWNYILLNILKFITRENLWIEVLISTYKDPVLYIVTTINYWVLLRI